MNQLNHYNNRTGNIQAAFRIARVAGAMLAVSFTLGNPIQVAAQPVNLDLPEGLACSFPLRIESTGAPNRVFKTLKDKNGNEVKIIAAGQGYDVKYTNLQTGASLLVRPSGGSVSVATRNPDGTTTVRLSGHNGLIFFPSDTPAGPTTTLYTGTVVYTVDQTGNFTFVSSSGKKTDICAALS